MHANFRTDVLTEYLGKTSICGTLEDSEKRSWNDRRN